MLEFKGWNHPLSVISPDEKEFKNQNPLSSDTIAEAIEHAIGGDKIYRYSPIASLVLHDVKRKPCHQD